MPTQRLALDPSWVVSQRVEATEDTAVLITHNATQNYPVWFAITDSAAQPGFPTSHGHPLPRGATESLTLKAGEYLWLAAGVQNFGEITITTGAA